MPALLDLALTCETYRTLPYSGGVMEQPAGLLRKMRKVENVWRAVWQYRSEGKKAGAQAKWKRENEDAWAIVKMVEELRAGNG